MAESRSRNMTCHLHEHKSYKYYCKQCKECICSHCIEELHGNHTFCRLKGAEDDIRKELKSIVDGSEENCEYFSSIQIFWKKMHEDLSTNKAQLIKQIDGAVDVIMLEVNESKQKLLSYLDGLFADRENFVSMQQEKLECIRSKITEIDTPSMDLSNVVEIVMDARKAFTESKKFTAKHKKIQFSVNKSEVSIGQFKDVNTDDLNFGTETGVLPAHGNDSGRRDAQALITTIENSSDEAIKDIYPMVISDKNLICVNKIMPISKDDAWINISRNLRKISSNTLESTIYVSDIDDFTAVVNGSVLVVSSDNSFIRERLCSGKIVPFADVGECDSYFPCTLSLHNDFVYVNIGSMRLYHDEYNRLKSDITFSRISVFTLDGIQVSSTDVSIFANGINPSLTIHSYQTESETFQYCLFTSFSDWKSCVLHLGHKKSEYPIKIATFRGVFGAKPETQFECFGACVDTNGHILVSDFKYKKVYALDKKLKFKSVVLSNADIELTKPRGLAVFDDILWVADDEKIYKFKYNSKDTVLCK